MLEQLGSALQQVVAPDSLAMLLLGVAIGFVVGILPGLGGAVTLALLIPITFGMDPVPAFSLLLGMYVVCAVAGDFTSVLFGIPGEASAAAMVLDGFPLNKKGQAGRALGAALASSVIGAVFGVAVLTALIPVLSPLVLMIGPPELFAIGLLGLAFVASLSGKNMFKGSIMAALGVLLSLVGLDPNTGIPRYTFGSLELWEGIGIVPVVVGLLGGAELLQIMLDKDNRTRHHGRPKVGGIRTGVLETAKHWFLVVRASAIGVAVGIVPGLGGSMAQFIAYGHAKQTSKKPERFGRGAIEGVIASGATSTAKDGGALVPTIAFGVPSSVSMAVLLGAFVILGLDPGPSMLTDDLDVTLSMVWIVVLATVAAAALGYVLLRPLTHLTRVKGRVLVPSLILLLTLGAYSESNSFANVLVMLLFLAVGVVAIRWDWPRVPLLLGLVLGAILERYFILSHSIYDWEWLGRPSVIAIIAVALLLVVSQILRALRKPRTAVDTPRTKEGAAV
ncbi:tripartite tricarboxylate transporter permease [Streptomyces sp. TRM S81-3]|uniref:Tripartite tricarboxylate transporter permease n=1 Tax=Streptomyces griseicoloratus TaxID=2752516 RepID=A0A926LBP9_9ACTN|nr:tripartite tricarboxylate transporter permease [Streptomyces griseicoloratus]MBD0423648.1 tripartite tricarboxylate transporter permease [Streptomyces griseicoloratus]